MNTERPTILEFEALSWLPEQTAGVLKMQWESFRRVAGDYIFLQAHNLNNSPEDNALIIEKMSRKIRHTQHVIDYGLSIYHQTPQLQSALTPEEIIAAATWHDIGRFVQLNKNGNYNDLALNHAQIGADLIAFPEIINLPAGVNRQRVSQAIRFHNDIPRPDRPLPDDPLFQLLQDADQLEIVDHAQDTLFACLGVNTVTEKLPDGNGQLSDKTVVAFLQNQLIETSTGATFADRLLLQLAWINQLKFPATRQAFIAKSLAQKHLDIIKIANGNSQPEIIAQIQGKINHWTAQNLALQGLVL